MFTSYQQNVAAKLNHKDGEDHFENVAKLKYFGMTLPNENEFTDKLK